ncbi:Dynein heavy chain family protein [Trichomonas vaginalis G3]|uniref:Dynein heavy chain family protein n=1 Tax=Trichomonas vaginalis (strain ATCC PRA-98 / G3) TaxID=412133 RepID=A2FDL6_TRIV3|nr:dynein light chain binding [Trichomonas vaginalis G3]EAX96997.1 Dynein heavy chain family protein [Trichomonas vaginalis G3]KAI5487316.1 dynein light chain binding [Trichomonas vaginalis G3]|eukprot:XP_001309927.1 Dynein heavy chain family protein [Trichomonas vaginalis G3]
MTSEETAENMEQSTEEIEVQQKDLQAAVAWFKTRMQLPGYNDSLWTPYHDQVVFDFLTCPTVTGDAKAYRLFATFDDAGKFVLTPLLPQSDTREVIYFLRRLDVKPNYNNLTSCIQWGHVQGRAVNTLLTSLEGFYLPLFVKSQYLPDSIHQDIMPEMNKFLGFVTDSSNSFYGETILYIPHEDLTNIEACVQDRALIQRLESIVIQWTGQLKTPVQIKFDSVGPLAEIEYWEFRLKTSKSLQAQIDSTPIQQVIAVLSAVKSRYLADFQTHYNKVKEESVMAKSIIRHLRVLIEPCNQLSQGEVSECTELLRKILFAIRFIYEKSPYYHDENHLSVLLKRVSDLVMHFITSKINLDNVFSLEGDVNHGLDILTIAVTVGASWNSTYKVAMRAVKSKDPNAWNFDHTQLFANFDAFISRCGDLKEICQNTIQFTRKKGTEAVPIPTFPGSIGSTISQSLQEIQDSYVGILKKLETSDCSVFDVSDNKWHTAFNEYCESCSNLESLLLNAIQTQFEAARTPTLALQLLEIFEDLAVRDGVKHLVSVKCSDMWKLFQEEIIVVRREFENLKANPPLPPHQPKQAGTMIWARSLALRLQQPFEQISAATWLPPYTYKNEVITSYQGIITSINDFINNTFNEYHKTIVESVRQALNKPILAKNTPTSIRASIEDRLVQAEEEIAHFIRMGKIISSTATEIVGLRDRTRDIVECVLNVVRDYNTIYECLKPDEQLLFHDHFQKIEHRIGDALTPKVYWQNTSLVNSFVNASVKELHQVHEIIVGFKKTSGNIITACKTISRTPIIQVQPGKHIFRSDEFYEVQKQCYNTALGQIMDVYNTTIGELRTMFNSFNINTLNVKEQWLSFLINVDYMLESAFKQAANKALFDLKRALTDETFPLFISQMDLVNGKCSITPGFDDIKQTLTSLMNGAISISSEFKPAYWSLKDDIRVIPDDDDVEEYERIKDPNYVFSQEKTHFSTFLTQIQSDDEIKNLSSQIETIINKLEEPFKAKVESWNKYKTIWDTDKPTELRRLADTEMTLSQFNQKIDDYKVQSNQIQATESTSTQSFVRLDSSPLQSSLLTHCSDWTSRLIKLLNDVSHEKLHHFYEMFSEKTAKLRETPTNIPELGALLQFMAEVKESIPQTEKLFAPLQENFDALVKFEYPIDPKDTDLLTSLAERWKEFKESVTLADKQLEQHRDAFKKKHIAEVEEIGQLQTDMYNQFMLEEPFKASLGFKAANEILDRYDEKVRELRLREDALRPGCNLFKLDPPVYKEISTVKTDIGLLRQVWRLYDEWDNMFNKWCSDPFKKLDVASMEGAAVTQAKQVANLGLKNWDVATVLAQKIQQFKKMMPLISNLKEPAINERHWNIIMKELDVTFDPNSDSFNLAAIYEMKFQEHADIIATIAMIASKEYEVQMGINEITDRWGNLHFETDPHRGAYKIIQSDKIYDQIEQDQTQLSTMKATLGSMKATRFFSPFDQTAMNNLEQNLTKVLELTDLLLQVQRQWIYLEAIFSGSETIRKDLLNQASEFGKVHQKWRDIMELLRRDSTTCFRAVKEQDIVTKLKQMNEKLEEIQKVLESFLQSKRNSFPRFYFLSNDDLLEIISKQKDPKCVLPHLKKMFGGMTSLRFDTQANSEGKPQPVAVTMSSAEGEEVKFETPVQISGDVDIWLREIENEMRRTIHTQLSRCRTAILKTNYIDKAKVLKDDQFPGQCFITAGQIKWTMECERALESAQKAAESAGGKAVRITAQSHPLTQLLGSQILFIGELTNMIRDNLSPLLRKKVKALLIIEDHARDVINEIIKYGVNHNGSVTKDDFVWLKQLRFYWLKENEFCTIQQTFSSFEYDKEYIGNNPRLVITPLTDRCYLTLTSALQFKCGGNPQGPAGTGKTETVKDLAKAFAKFCIVFNCSEGLDFKSMGNIFSGLAQTGAWSCFDEFNRIEVEVLSVIAQQVQRLLDGIASGASQVCLDTSFIKLNPTCAIFVTMNPGYAGRSELPDNLKTLLRPVSMMVPDSSLIVKIELMSEGVAAGEALARKITTLYDLCKRQLSKQDHYDFGLRNIKSVLSMAGSLKRQNTGQSDELIILRSMTNMNLPKFVREDIPLFQSIMSDLFPDVELEQPAAGNVETAVVEALQADQLQVEPALVQKIMQLYDSMQTRHGNMLVGQTGSGKTTAYTILAKALNNIKTRTLTYMLNPKALSLGELYGQYDLNTRQWSEGVLSTVIRDVSIMEGDDLRWVIFDGPVDTLWIESMNSVLDDNKVLTLINSARISLPPPVSLLFEVEDLAVASPATVSRCGMIYFETSTIGYKPSLTSWMNRVITNDRHKQKLSLLCQKFVDLFIEYKHQALHDLIPVTDLNAVQTFCKLYETLATEANGVDPADEMNFDVMVESWFWFCLVWGIGGSLNEDGRREADLWIRDLECPFPAKDTVYDYYVDVQKHCLVAWEDKLPSVWKTPEVPFNQILVPTVDTIRNSFILKTLTDGNIHGLFVGFSGTGKTAFIENTLTTYDSNKYSSLTMNLSSRTTSNKLQEMIENAFEIRTKSTYVPIGGKKLVVFIDDFNMPQRDLFGSQPPLELLREWMETESWYDRTTCTPKILKDMQVVAAMAPPGGGRQPISRRLQSKFCLFNVSNPSDSQLKRIFNTLLSNHVAKFNEEVQSLAEPLTNATLELFQNIQKQFLPTPKKSHYIFNLRDMSRVFQGLLDANLEYFDDRTAFIKLWCHECFRVFADRLVNDDDRALFLKLLQGQLNTALSTTWPALFREDKEPTPHGAFVQEGPTWPYKEYPDFNVLQKFLINQLNDYNEMGNKVPMNLVLFKEASFHCCRIMRIIGRQFGHALLIGLGGSGRQSQCRLAANILEMQFFQITITKGYKERDFREDLKKVIDLTAIEQKPTVFFFSDTHILQESFLEDVLSILTSGCVPNLFEGEELQQRREAMRAEATKRKIVQTPQNLFNLYVQLSRENMHIVFSMSPAGNALRNRIRMFPPLVNNTTIDWFNEWPKQALQAVAENIMKDVDFKDENTKNAIVGSFVEFHSLADGMCNKMQTQLKRSFQLTPTTFMEFVKNYKTLLSQKESEITARAKVYRDGVATLVSTRSEVEIMSHDLEKLKVTLEAEKAKLEATSIQLSNTKKSAEDQEAYLVQYSQEIAKSAEECRIEQEAAEARLANVKPELDNAAAALESFKKNVNNIHEISGYKESVGAVPIVVEALMTLLGKPCSFQQAKVEMKDPGFIGRLTNFDKDHIPKSTLKKLQRYRAMPELDPKVAARSSTAASLLACWVMAMIRYGEAYQNVYPYMQKVALMKQAFEEKRIEYETKQKDLAELRAKLEQLRKDRDAQQAASDKLQQEARSTEIKLKRSNDLVNGLVGERTRWEESIKNFDQLLEWLPGDCFLAAAFLVYCGPFSTDYRQQLIGKWKKHIRSLKLSTNPDFTPTKFLDEAIFVQQWHLCGLALDDFSEENATLVLHGERWPLCIDPQNQANQWIKKMYKDKLLVMTTKKPKFDQQLEIALQTGQPVLLQDMGEDIDPALMPIINREFVKQGTTMMFKLGGDRLVALHPDFRLFMTTKMSNPEWTPEVTSRTTVINFSVKEQGLEEQMLGIVVGKERPELENEKVRLVTQMAQDKQTLHDTELQILQLLASKSSQELLNDDTVVTTLETSKHLSQNIGEKLKSAADTEKKIDAAREAYRSVARRASSLFFVLSDLAYVDPMYQFSLDAYTVLFNHSLSNAQHSDDTEQRNETIKKEHTLAVYRNTCRGLFEQHKLLFSFCLAVKVQQTGDQRGPGRIAADEYLYLLRGPVGLSPEVLEGGAKPEWLNEREWENILGLNTLPAFEGIAASFEQYNEDWYAWYMSQQPELVPFPGDWTRRCTLMQAMVIVRCLRPDRILSCISNYIENTIGEEFIKPPPLELSAAYHDSDAYTPLLFVLSPGVDPLTNLKRLATDMKIPEDSFHDLALGQGQAEIAKQLMVEGSQKGWWVYLSNCHLMLSWMDEFEGIFEEICLTKIDPKFRLWISSDPNPKFPISILQRAVKMTTESPSGIHANMQTLYSTIQTDSIDKATPTYKKLIFALCYLHSVIIERRKFLTLGWNIPYAFNRADFDICQKVIAKLLDTSPKAIPWEAMRFLISEIHYGGRVTDSWDQRLLDVYVHQYFQQDLIDVHGFKLCDNNLYFVPEPTNVVDAMQVIEKIPITDPPEAFGQHPNADISSLIQEGQGLLSTVLSLQPALSTASGASREDVVLNLAKDLLFNVPNTIVLPRLNANANTDALQIVLYQEIARYNKLLTVVRNSIEELIKGIQGLVVMSRELDEIFTCIYENKVPEMWQFAYQSLKPLALWSKDLISRVEFFKKWLEKGEPNAFWLGRFTYPTSFLTAVLQRSARLHKISIDQLEWQFNVMHTDNVRELEQQALIPKEGVLIRGLYLEGARWSKKNKVLCDPKPLQLISELPIIHFLPVDKTKKEKGNVYIAPAYIYPVRGGSSEHPSLVLPIELPTENDPDHWVKRGTAVLLTLK